MDGPDVSAAVATLSPPEHYQALYDVAHSVPSDQAIVELGTYYGASAIALGQGARDGSGAPVYTVDSHDLPGYRTTTGVGPRARNTIDYTDPAIRLQAAAAIRAAGLDQQVTMVQGFSEQVGQEWTGPRVGLLYIDGDHRQGAVRQDYAAWEPHLTRDATVVFDDFRDAFPGVLAELRRLVAKGVLDEPYTVGALAITGRRR